ncbi:transglutaminase [Arthrobacter sp. JZ12]|uniref:transglutaminase-like domain-containing protein n=1 Tax=Arthrobacter sp. JZ12 TaxID=2654190 RepID=UPI002B49E56D|nr:transglutaminase family protein [Arthrobacter sp. JZ12]WRH25204.1 transglutaminase [Arthrobacter sp. JZ12]
MNRSVTAHLTARTQANTEIALSVAVARNPGYTALNETLVVTADGEEIQAREVQDHHGGVLHALTIEKPAQLEVTYRAEVAGAATPPNPDAGDLIRYVRPSRYCDSDRLLPTSYSLFGSLRGSELLAAVREWVNSNLSYVSGSSRHTDGASDTLMARRGVCRDYAHLAISLLRAKDVPARLASAYAPGLNPMDFHAVVEAWVDGAWHVIDATGLAPRSTLLRIATGRDTADTAFLSTVGGSLSLQTLKVTAEADEVHDDDGTSLLQLR